MTRVETWFAEYGESHQDHTNKTIHWICVPAILFSLLGLMSRAGLPGMSNPWWNLATVITVLALGYYCALSVTLALGMAIISSAMLLAINSMSGAGLPVAVISIAIFVVAWIGQFAGHKIEGKKPSFLKDIQFLLIGPIWLLGFVYKRLGIPY